MSLRDLDKLWADEEDNAAGKAGALPDTFVAAVRVSRTAKKGGEKPDFEGKIKKSDLKRLEKALPASIQKRLRTPLPAAASKQLSREDLGENEETSRPGGSVVAEEVDGEEGGSRLKVRSVASTRYKELLSRLQPRSTQELEMVGPYAEDWSGVVTYGRDVISLRIRQKLLRRVFLLLLMEHCMATIVIFLFLSVGALRAAAATYWPAFLAAIPLNAMVWFCLLQEPKLPGRWFTNQLLLIVAYQVNALIYALAITGLNGLMLGLFYPLTLKDVYVYNGIYVGHFGVVYGTIVLGSLQVTYPIKSARHMNYFFMCAYFSSNFVSAGVVGVVGKKQGLVFSPLFVALLLALSCYLGWRTLVLRLSSYFLISENSECPVDPAQFVRARMVIVNEYYFKPPKKMQDWMCCGATRMKKMSIRREGGQKEPQESEEEAPS